MAGNVHALVGAGMAFASLFLTGCGDRYSWNQKLTVVVDTPQGEVSGSSVTSVWWLEGGNWNTGWTFDYEGEAVVLELPRGRHLFAINSHDEGPGSSNTEWAGTVAPASIAGLPGRILREGLFAEVASKSGRAAAIIQIPPYQYPTLVTFKDITDPKTAENVDPLNLAGTFGRGYRLKSVTLEITDEGRTHGQVQNILPWLVGMSTLLDGSSIHRISPPGPFSNSLGPGDFSTEIKK